MQVELQSTSMIETQPETISVVAKQATGFRRWLFVGSGLLFVGIAVLGAILPVLPTTPWVLLAGACFARSSPRLHSWLQRSPYFGHMLRDWEMHRGIRWRVKAFAICMIVTVIGLTVTLRNPPEWAKWSAAGLGCVGICTIILVVPTVWDSQLKRKSADGEVVAE